LSIPLSPELLFGLLGATMLLALLALWLAWRAARSLSALQQTLPDTLAALVSEQGQALHRAVLNDLREALASSSERQSVRLAQLEVSQAERAEALKGDLLGSTVERINQQAREAQEATLGLLADSRRQFAAEMQAVRGTLDARLAEIGGKVNERLDEGFRKTNETFVSVMQRLATIDEAQRKIDGLTTNVVSLQQLLGDKRARGALGEMQLEAIIRNQMPETTFELQYTFASGLRADCVLKMPEPTGLVAIDAKFPLENYERLLAGEASPAAFKADIRRHIADIAQKYIQPGETGDGALMFVPAEAVFAQIHAHHRDLVEYAQQRRVWLVSPTTLMAVLNTARAVIKDVETRRQVHVIKDELGKLGTEFSRFDERMGKLAEHIRLANEETERVRITSEKISKRFTSIEQVRLEAPS
jgi:DNA recombination protein RmuC